MDTGLLHLHNILRWIILLLLLLTLYHSFSKNPGIRKSSLWLLIFSHLMLLIGLYQLITGRYGIMKGLPPGVELMKDSFYRFFWIEHPLMMILAIILITIARGKAKVLNYRATGWLLLVALLLILIAIPWAFREGGIGRPWFPGGKV
jgi:disulfide bond formation protein DsbB